MLQVELGAGGDVPRLAICQLTHRQKTLPGVILLRDLDFPRVSPAVSPTPPGAAAQCCGNGHRVRGHAMRWWWG